MDQSFLLADSTPFIQKFESRDDQKGEAFSTITFTPPLRVTSPIPPNNEIQDVYRTHKKNPLTLPNRSDTVLRDVNVTVHLFVA
jgi:hypothetical protein